MDIKQDILNVCDDMIFLWDQLKAEMEALPDEDVADVICKWQDYFEENANIITNFSMTKRNIEEIKQSLVMNGKLKYVD